MTISVNKIILGRSIFEENCLKILKQNFVYLGELQIYLTQKFQT